MPTVARGRAPGTGGFASFDASLARSFVRATPTAQRSPFSSKTATRIDAAVAAPSPKSRRAPLTSRNASSSAMPSITGVKRANTSWMRRL
jgi:hypothetical protein